jgi:predicted enzyme related to lactoylglutathione lyase
MTMANPIGSFVWYELMTPDPDAAAAFYGAVIGWKISAQPSPEAVGVDYRMIVRDDGGMAGGVLKLTDEMIAHKARPWWLPYLYVPDVDTAVAAIEAEGGKVAMPATDLPVGRIAMVIDPQSVPIYLITPVPPPGQPDAATDVFDEHAAQRVRWNELASPDLDGSLAFYAAHFGFEFNERMPIGAMGDYCFVEHHGKTLGAMMSQHDAGQQPLWLQYFGVPSVVAAKAAVEAGGGQVLMGPHEVPGGNWIVIAHDPHGARFGLVADRGD